MPGSFSFKPTFSAAAMSPTVGIDECNSAAINACMPDHQADTAGTITRFGNEPHVEAIHSCEPARVTP
jgi:hypothetical protein